MGLLSFLNPLAARFPELLNPLHRVGYVAVHHPPSRPLVLAQPTLAASGEPVLRCESLSWVLFYPSGQECGKAKGVEWLVKPVHALVTGYSRFLDVSRHLLSPVFGVLAHSTVIPALFPNSPLLAPPTETKWPLLIISHGLGGSKHVYSQICRYLASQGCVVLMLESKDGTAPCATIHRGTSSEELLYIRNEELTWDPPLSSASDKLPLRREQLKIRQVEVREAFLAFSSLVRTGEVAGLVVEDGNPSALGPQSGWKDSVDLDEIFMGGHSFGGATTLTCITDASLPEASHLPSLPITKCLLLDPWLEPLSKCITLPPSPPSVLCAMSEGFTIWSSHHARVVALAEAWSDAKERWLVTLLRSTHQSFSDFPLLIPTLPSVSFPFTTRPPTSTSTPESMLNTIVQLSSAFLMPGVPLSPPSSARSSSVNSSATSLGSSLPLKGAGGARSYLTSLGWDGQADNGRVTLVEDEGAKKGKGGHCRKVMEGKEGEVRVHFKS